MTPDERKAYLYALRDREDTGERHTLMLGPWQRALIPGIVWYVTHNGPEPAPLTQAEHKALRQREQAGERGEIPIGPYTAMLLIGGIQAVTRHDEFFAKYAPGLFEPMVDQLRLVFVDDPKAAEIIYEGEKSQAGPDPGRRSSLS